MSVWTAKPENDNLHPPYECFSDIALHNSCHTLQHAFNNSILQSFYYVHYLHTVTDHRHGRESCLHSSIIHLIILASQRIQVTGSILFNAKQCLPVCHIFYETGHHYKKPTTTCLPQQLTQTQSSIKQTAAVIDGFHINAYNVMDHNCNAVSVSSSQKGKMVVSCFTYKCTDQFEAGKKAWFLLTSSKKTSREGGLLRRVERTQSQPSTPESVEHISKQVQWLDIDLCSTDWQKTYSSM